MAAKPRTDVKSPRQFKKIQVPGPPHGFDTSASGLYHPQIARMSDIGQPELMTQAVTNIMGVAGRATPQEVTEGREWYPKVHDAVAKGVKKYGLDSVLHGAGVVAGVSPNMDFEENNIHAFEEMHRLRQNPEHMAALHRSLGNIVHVHDKKGKPKFLKDGSPQMGQQRSAEWRAIVTQHYPGIAAAPDSNILKSHMMMQGAHPDEVLDPRTAPKTNSFAHNIADPSATRNPHNPARTLATVDGRAHDIATNTMHQWSTGRGINSSLNKRGGMTRYEHFTDAHGQAAQVMSSESSREVTPSEAQARTWVVAKRMELEMPGAKKRKATGDPYQGPPRTGQPYLP